MISDRLAAERRALKALKVSSEAEQLADLQITLGRERERDDALGAGREVERQRDQDLLVVVGGDVQRQFDQLRGVNSARNSSRSSASRRRGSIMWTSA